MVNYFLQFILNGVVDGAIFAMAGLGFALVYNTTHIFHISYGALFTAAAYLLYSGLQFNIGILPSIAFSLGGTALIGYLVEKLVYRPLHKKKFPLVIFIISSIGVMIVLINVIALVWGNEPRILVTEVSKVFKIGGVLLTEMQIYQFFSCALVIFLILILLKKTKLVIFLRAMRDNDDLTSVFGVNVLRMRTYVFIISSILVAVAGCLVAYDTGMDPHGGMDILLTSIVALIIGGIGRFEGVIWGGLILGVIKALVVAQISTKWSSSAVFIILIIFLIFRPYGIQIKRNRQV